MQSAAKVRLPPFMSICAKRSIYHKRPSWPPSLLAHSRPPPTIPMQRSKARWLTLSQDWVCRDGSVWHYYFLEGQVLWSRNRFVANLRYGAASHDVMTRQRLVVIVGRHGGSEDQLCKHRFYQPFVRFNLLGTRDALLARITERVGITSTQV